MPNGDWRTHLLGALENLGPSTVAELAAALDLPVGTVASQLARLAEEQQVFSKGHAPYEPGKRGSPPALWHRGQPEPDSTSDSSPSSEVAKSEAPPQRRQRPTQDERITALSRQLSESLTARERLENDLAAASRRAEEADRRRVQAEARADRAERAQEDASERARATADLETRLEAALASVVDLEAELADARANGDTPIMDLPEGDARRVDFEHRIRMRERYFDTLLAAAGHEGTSSPDILDRIERLIDGPEGHA